MHAVRSLPVASNRQSYRSSEIQQHLIAFIGNRDTPPDWLAQSEYSTLMTTNFFRDWARIAILNPSLAIVEWQLPQVEGIHVCRHLASAMPTLPIMLLAPSDRVEQRIAGSPRAELMGRDRHSATMLSSLFSHPIDTVISTLFACSIATILGLGRKLYLALTAAPQLEAPQDDMDWPSLATIVPAYNEVDNVVGCLSHILDSTDRPLQLYLADDGSTDTTLQLARAFAAQRQDDRLHILSTPPRPEAEAWVGKNWACDWAARQIEADYLLFVDCDVRLQPGAIEAAVDRARQQEVGLLSVGPEIVCGCWAEWLVQPVMMAVLGAGFDYIAVNDPASEEAFGAGPFMLFRQSAYRAIGGHAAVGDRVVEDVELAKLAKRRKLGLYYSFSGGLVQSRMYRDTASLWEGWSKNLFEGLERKWRLWLVLIAALVVIYLLPWVALVAGLATGRLLWLGLGCIGLLCQSIPRGLLWRWGGLPPNYWWLSGLGGAIAIAILVSSAYRTSTGRGWTWRGRSLQSASRRS